MSDVLKPGPNLTDGNRSKADLLLEELRRAKARLSAGDSPDQAGITTSEYAQMIGRGRQQARTELLRLVKSGVIQTTMVVRTNAWGISQRIPGYDLCQQSETEAYDDR